MAAFFTNSKFIPVQTDPNQAFRAPQPFTGYRPQKTIDDRIKARIAFEVGAASEYDPNIKDAFEQGRRAQYVYAHQSNDDILHEDEFEDDGYENQSASDSNHLLRINLPSALNELYDDVNFTVDQQLNRALRMSMKAPKVVDNGYPVSPLTAYPIMRAVAVASNPDSDKKFTIQDCMVISTNEEGFCYGHVSDHGEIKKDMHLCAPTFVSGILESGPSSLIVPLDNVDAITDSMVILEQVLKNSL